MKRRIQSKSIASDYKRVFVPSQTKRMGGNDYLSVNPKMKQLTCLLAFIFFAVKPKGGRWEKLKGRRTVGSTKNSVEKTVKGTSCSSSVGVLALYVCAKPLGLVPSTA